MSETLQPPPQILIETARKSEKNKTIRNLKGAFFEELKSTPEKSFTEKEVKALFTKAARKVAR